MISSSGSFYGKIRLLFWNSLQAVEKKFWDLVSLFLICHLLILNSHFSQEIQFWCELSKAEGRLLCCWPYILSSLKSCWVSLPYSYHTVHSVVCNGVTYVFRFYIFLKMMFPSIFLFFGSSIVSWLCLLVRFYIHKSFLKTYYQIVTFVALFG